MKARSGFWVLAWIAWTVSAAAQPEAAPTPAPGATASFPPPATSPPPATPPPPATSPPPATPPPPATSAPAAPQPSAAPGTAPAAAAPPPAAGQAPIAPAAGWPYPPGPYTPPGPAPARAPEPPLPQQAPPPRRERHVSLSLSPLHLLSGPVLELMAELRLVDHVGASLFGGLGEYTVEDELDRDIDAAVWEIGGQLGWYPLESFSSVVLGAELAYVHIETEQLPNSSVTVLGAGLAVGPFVGYKLISSSGFTFLAHAGVQYITLRAEEQEGDATLDEDERARFVPLLNLNLGWSF